MQLSTSTALDVAAYLHRAVTEQTTITRPKLHRLTYLARGAHYVTWGTHAFADPTIAFADGPGYWSIEGSCALDQTGSTSVDHVEGGHVNDVTPDLATTLELVVAYFGGLTASDLDAYTTQPGSPWDVVIHDRDCTTTTPPITDELIQTWFLGHPLDLVPSSPDQLQVLSPPPTRPDRQPLNPPVVIPGHYPRHS
jgi:uncharacterized phage-associated protein